MGATSTSLHPAAERRHERGLHLHALDHGDDVADLDLVADLHRDRHDDGRGAVADDPAVVARDAMWHAVDLDQELGCPVARRRAR